MRYVIITQDPADLERKLKAVVETTFQMVKLKNLGRPKNYRIEIYQRANTRRKPQQVLVRKYDPKIFALYSSYDGKGGQEKVIDSRQNMLKGGFFKLVIPIVVVLGLWGSWAVAKVLNPGTKQTASSVTPGDKNKTPGGDSSKPGLDKTEEKPASLPQYRIVGVTKYSSDLPPTFTVEKREGARIHTLVMQSPHNWALDETGYSMTYKGEKIREAQYEARASTVLGHTPGSSADFKLPFSPP